MLLGVFRSRPAAAAFLSSSPCGRSALRAPALASPQRPTTAGAQHPSASAQRSSSSELAGTSYAPSPARRRRRTSVHATAQLGSVDSSTPRRRQHATSPDVMDQQIPQLRDDAAALPSMQDLQDILPRLSPKQLADAIWAFAKSEVKPTLECLDIIASEVHSKLPEFRCQDLSNTVWALAVLQYQPSRQWWDDFERQVYRNLPDFGDRELANVLWSLAVLDHRPVMVLETLLEHASERFGSYSANSLHLVAWSLGKLGYSPSAEWLTSFLAAAQGAFFQLAPAEMANLFWALAKLGHKLPAKWVDHFLLVAQWRFPSFSARLLSILVWSAAVMDHRPSQEWLLCFEEQVREKFSDFSGQELACVAWALRKLGCSTERNAVFYMLDRQERFVSADFDMLSNPQLLQQMLTWQHATASAGVSGPSPSSASAERMD